MWIFIPDSFISVVQKPGDTHTLTVRARIKGDIESVFPEAYVEADKGTGYKQKKQQATAEQLSTAQADEAMVEQDNAEQATTEAPKAVEADQQPRQPKPRIGLKSKK